MEARIGKAVRKVNRPAALQPTAGLQPQSASLCCPVCSCSIRGVGVLRMQDAEHVAGLAWRGATEISTGGEMEEKRGVCLQLWLHM